MTRSARPDPAGRGLRKTPMPHAGVRSILRNTTYLAGARAVTIAARAAYALVIAGLLGPELYGLFNYALSWYLLFVPLAILGLDFVLLREIGRRRSASTDVVPASLALRTGGSILVAALCLGLGWWLEVDPLARRLLLVLAFALVGRGLASWTNAVFKGHEASGFVLAQEVAFRLLEVLVGLALLAAGYGVLVLALAHAGAWIAQGAMGLFLVRRFLHPGLRADWSPWPMVALLRSGLPFLAAAFLLGWLLQGPLVLHRHLEGTDIGLGQLALALQVFVIFGSVVAELGLAAVPVLTRSSERRDGKTVLFVQGILRAGWLLGAALVTGALTVGPPLLAWLFGANYDTAGDLLPWAMLLVGPYFWATSLRSVLAAHGRYWEIAAAMLTGAVVFSILYVPLADYSGLQGALYAEGLGLVGVAATQLWLLRGTDAPDLGGSMVLPGLVSLAAVAAAGNLLHIHPLLALGVGLAVLAAGALLAGTIPLRTVRRFLTKQS